MICEGGDLNDEKLGVLTMHDESTTADIHLVKFVTIVWCPNEIYWFHMNHAHYYINRRIKYIDF